MFAFSTPLVFGAIAGMFSERSGVVNIGLEGMMLTGAFFGIWGSDVTGSWALGLLIAIAFGGLVALVYAFFAIHLRTDQIIGGTAINFLALGVTGYAFIDIYGSNGTPSLTNAESIPDVNLHLGGIEMGTQILRRTSRGPHFDFHSERFEERLKRRVRAG